MYSKHTTGYTCKRYNMCKMSYAPSHSSLMIFCKTLCYPIGISQYMIENDSFQRKMCCTLVNKRLSHAYRAELT